MATEAADLRINVRATGTAKTAAELQAVDQAIDDVDGSSVQAGGSLAELSSAMSVLGVSSAVVGGAPLIAVAGGIGAIAGGAIAAVPGVIGLGGAFAYVGLQSLKAATGTTDLKEAWAKLTDAGTPLGKALAGLKKQTEDMSGLFMRFINTTGPAVVEGFGKIVNVLENNLRPALRTISEETGKWVDIWVRSAKRVGPVLDDLFKTLSHGLAEFANAFIPAIRPALDALGVAFRGLVDGLISIFQPMIPFIDETGRGFADTFRTLGDELGKIALTLAPLIKPFFEALNKLLEDLGDTLNNLAKGIVEAWKGFAPLLSAVGDLLVALSPLFEPLGKFISLVAQALTPVIKVLAGTIDALMPILSTLLDWFGKIASFIMSPLGTALTWLDNAFGSLGDNLAEKAIAAGVFDEALAPLKERLDDTGSSSRTAGEKIAALGGSFEFAQEAFTDSEHDIQLVTGALQRLAGQAKVTGREIVKAFIKQQNAIANYETNWETFMSRNPPQQLVDSLKEMGLDGAAILQGFVRMSDRKWAAVMRGIEGPAAKVKTFTDRLWDLKAAIEALPERTTVAVDFALHGRGMPDTFTNPKFGAKGAIVTKPTLFVAGEEGPEAIVPLSGRNALSPLPSLATGFKQPVKLTGEVAFDWRRGIADLEGALVDSDRRRGW